MLYKIVIVRRFYDPFAISIPFFVVVYSIMTVALYARIGFVDFESSSLEDSTGFRLTYWVYVTIYGIYHWLCAIQYLQTSVTLPIAQKEAQLIKQEIDESKPKIDPLFPNASFRNRRSAR